MQDALLEFPTPLHKAAFYNDANQMESLMQEEGYNQEKCSLDQTPLIMLVRGRAENDQQAQDMATYSKLFIKAGADVNTPDRYGDTPLILAVMDGGGLPKVGTVKALVEAGADVNKVCENFKKTPLHWAAVGGCTDIARILVDAGSRLNKINRERETPLQVAKRQMKRLQDGLDHFGNEYKKDDKAKQIGKYSDFVEYMESLPGIKKD